MTLDQHDKSQTRSPAHLHVTRPPVCHRPTSIKPRTRTDLTVSAHTHRTRLCTRHGPPYGRATRPHTRDALPAHRKLSRWHCLASRCLARAVSRRSRGSGTATGPRPRHWQRTNDAGFADGALVSNRGRHERSGVRANGTGSEKRRGCIEEHLLS